jgi:Mg-chelatase subunit ChlD
MARFATLFVSVAIACSDDGGSTVELGSPATAGARSSGGSAASAGSAIASGSTTASGSSANSSGAAAASGSATSPGTGGAPSEACAGLPIDNNLEAGAAGADAAGAATVEACDGVSLEAEAVPVDVLVMMDRSQSMGLAVEGSTMTRWQALHAAVQSFATDPGAAEIGAGIGFFSRSGNGDDARDCDPNAYAEPEVPIGSVSEVGLDLVAAMDAVAPGGLTPTVPALQGAISYARSSAQANPGRATSVVLVTDGFPTQCDNEPDRIAQAARAGYESPEHIRTFVIGVGDVARFNLDRYARSGGTRTAYLTDAGDVTRSFVQALNNITDRALACEYQLPPPPDGMKLDSTKVQVTYTPAVGDTEEVPSIASFAACARNPNGGWYYDDTEQPSKITVCPCTCARLQAGRVDVRLGCKPRLGLR